MSGEPDRPADRTKPTEASDAPRSDSPPPRTPDESTMGVASSAEPVQASAEADLPHLRNGESLAGRFTVLRFIARGGMGAVYEANDLMLRTRIALKVIRGRIATDATAMERFPLVRQMCEGLAAAHAEGVIHRDFKSGQGSFTY